MNHPPLHRRPTPDPDPRLNLDPGLRPNLDRRPNPPSRLHRAQVRLNNLPRDPRAPIPRAVVGSIPVWAPRTVEAA